MAILQQDSFVAPVSGDAPQFILAQSGEAKKPPKQHVVLDTNSTGENISSRLGLTLPDALDTASSSLAENATVGQTSQQHAGQVSDLSSLEKDIAQTLIRISPFHGIKGSNGSEN